MNEDAIAIAAPMCAAIQTALDNAKAHPGCDAQWLAIARTDFEKALLAFGTALDGGGILNG
jgi:hypothetical protein